MARHPERTRGIEERFLPLVEMTTVFLCALGVPFDIAQDMLGARKSYVSDSYGREQICAIRDNSQA